ncbi:hypothetical protein PSHT_11641 [Puccinia striiformis]|uniref:Uncharacterized protein n=1 Tax=Puccinia striiformis TaxID=27350 RepID=A0A2S4V244_9BASI|nr:hypothetical protein PSHT_11641 [Puccinia striiformis]
MSVPQPVRLTVSTLMLPLDIGKLSNTPSLPVGITPPPPADKALPEAFLSLSIEDVHQLLNISSHMDLTVICIITARFYLDTINKAPAVLIVNLKTVLFYVTQQISLAASSYLLKLDRQLVEIVASQGLTPLMPPRTLSYSENIALDAYPKCTQTIIRHLAINPDLNYLICCPKCFAMYPESSAPENCVHSTFQSCENEPSEGDTQDLPPLNEDTLLAERNMSGIEDALTAVAARSRAPYNATMEMSDIHDSRTWKEFRGPDGRQFTSNASNITFGMFMDGINPYGNRQAGKHASVTFIILVCLSLPVSLRYSPENIFIAGIAPGPKEPSLEEVNWILRPVIEQLKSLWEPGVQLSKTYKHSTGRLVFAALLPFFADLPALRRALGFASTSAERMCSYCLLKKNNINNIEQESWPLQSLDDHRHWAKESLKAPNLKAQKQILDDHGVRYSIFLELPYWNILDYHVVDSMHNLLLGLLKWQCTRFWQMSDVEDEIEPTKVASVELHKLLQLTLRYPIAEKTHNLINP